MFRRRATTAAPAPDAPADAPAATVDRLSAANGAAAPAPRPVDRLIEAVRRQVLARSLAGRPHGRAGDPALGDRLVDGLVATGREPQVPDEIFRRLRWGGLFCYVAEDARAVHRLAEAYDNKRGFILEQPPTHIWHAPLGLRLPPLANRGHYFVARKTQLAQAGDVTDRFTYLVDLVPHAPSPWGYVVRKRVPDREYLIWRLAQTYPDLGRAELERRARNLAEQIFPMFLTREAAFLKLLERHLPEEHRGRVPALLQVNKDHRGYVHELYMNWMRHRVEPIDHLELARQSIELLCALHDHVGIMHLDLRLDNVVLGERGVGFVDFGSAVRIGEQLHRSDMLHSLFDEMMQTSQIQRLLGRMLERGEITNEAIRGVHGKVDKTVDVFYLALQINQAHHHPELKHLIRHDPESPATRHLERLTAAVLRPKNPHKSSYKTAADLRRGIDRVERKLARTPPASGTPRRARATAV